MVDGKPQPRYTYTYIPRAEGHGTYAYVHGRAASAPAPEHQVVVPAPVAYLYQPQNFVAPPIMQDPAHVYDTQSRSYIIGHPYGIHYQSHHSFNNTTGGTAGSPAATDKELVPAPPAGYAYVYAPGTYNHDPSPAPIASNYLYGRTKEEVDLDARRIATARGAYKPRKIKPADAEPDDMFWAREKNGDWHLRTYYQIENDLQPGTWKMDAEKGYLCFHRE